MQTSTLDVGSPDVFEYDPSANTMSQETTDVGGSLIAYLHGGEHHRSPRGGAPPIPSVPNAVSSKSDTSSSKVVDTTSSGSVEQQLTAAAPQENESQRRVERCEEEQEEYAARRHQQLFTNVPSTKNPLSSIVVPPTSTSTAAAKNSKASSNAEEMRTTLQQWLASASVTEMSALFPPSTSAGGGTGGSGGGGECAKSINMGGLDIDSSDWDYPSHYPTSCAAAHSSSESSSSTTTNINQASREEYLVKNDLLSTEIRTSSTTAKEDSESLLSTLELQKNIPLQKNISSQKDYPVCRNILRSDFDPKTTDYLSEASEYVLHPTQNVEALLLDQPSSGSCFDVASRTPDLTGLPPELETLLFAGQQEQDVLGEQQYSQVQKPLVTGAEESSTSCSLVNKENPVAAANNINTEESILMTTGPAAAKTTSSLPLRGGAKKMSLHLSTSSEHDQAAERKKPEGCVSSRNHSGAAWERHHSALEVPNTSSIRESWVTRPEETSRETSSLFREPNIISPAPPRSNEEVKNIYPHCGKSLIVKSDESLLSSRRRKSAKKKLVLQVFIVFGVVYIVLLGGWCVLRLRSERKFCLSPESFSGTARLKASFGDHERPGVQKQTSRRVPAETSAEKNKTPQRTISKFKGMFCGWFSASAAAITSLLVLLVYVEDIIPALFLLRGNACLQPLHFLTGTSSCAPLA